MTTRREGRLEHIDVLRAVAIIAVLAGHVWYDGWPQRLIYAWHVPLFFLLSGLLWRPGRTVRQELRHRWPVLVTPYICWWLLVFVVSAVWLVAQGEEVTPGWVLLSAWGGSAALRPFTAFWFFSAFLVALLTLRLLERFPRWISYAVAIGAIALCLIAPETVGSPGWVMRRLPLAFGTGVAGSFFILVGQDLARITQRRGVGPWGLGALFIGFGLVLLPGYESLEMKHAVYGTPGLSVLAACLIAGGMVLASPVITDRLPTQVLDASRWLSTLAVPIMLGQGIFLMMLDTGFEGSWSDFAITVIGSIALAWLLRKSPVGDWFCGPEVARVPARS